MAAENDTEVKVATEVEDGPAPHDPEGIMLEDARTAVDKFEGAVQKFLERGGHIGVPTGIDNIIVNLARLAVQAISYADIMVYGLTDPRMVKLYARVEAAKNLIRKADRDDLFPIEQKKSSESLLRDTIGTYEQLVVIYMGRPRQEEMMDVIKHASNVTVAFLKARLNGVDIMEFGIRYSEARDEFKGALLATDVPLAVMGKGQ